MSNTVYVKKITNSLPYNDREIWRYSGYMGLPKEENLSSLLDEVKNECEEVISPSVCYATFDISWDRDMPILPFSSFSKDLAKCLKDCRQVVMFAATIGFELDRKIAKYQKVSPSKALVMQGFGAERVEAVCDFFCKDFADEIAEKGLVTTPRFSPGYGDLPLDKQVDFFRILDINHKIGITLSDSLLMRPSKSVTAVFGLKKQLTNKN